MATFALIFNFFSSVALGLILFRGGISRALAAFVYFVMITVAEGLILSEADKLASEIHWLALSAMALIPAALLATRFRPRFHFPTESKFEGGPAAASVLAFISLAGAVLALQALSIAPASWDALNYHIPRVLYFLQQGNLDSFTANYWAQVEHPRNSVIVNSLLLLAFFKNEFAFHLLQYFSYWIYFLAIFGICRVGFGYHLRSSIFTAACFAMMPVCLYQASSATNDLFLAALISASIYFIAIAAPVTAALALALALGTKSNVLLILPSFFIAIVARHGLNALVRTCAALAVFGALLAWPSGYRQNLKTFGHPAGSVETRDSHALLPNPTALVFSEGSKNLLRLGIDSLRFDGLPKFIGQQVQDFTRSAMTRSLNTVGIDLEASDAPRWLYPNNYEEKSEVHFSNSRELVENEGGASGGVIGILILSTFLIYGLRRERRFDISLPFMIFILLNAIAMRYDPWRFRYLVMGMPLLAPFVAKAWESKRRIARILLPAAFATGLISAVSVLAFPNGMSLVSILKSDRLTQATRFRPDYKSVIEKFEEQVPFNARVAIDVGPRKNEYLFFGSHIQRTLIPTGRIGWLDPSADFYLYTSTTRKKDQDIELGRTRDDKWFLQGENWYLRRLR